MYILNTSPQGQYIFKLKFVLYFNPMVFLNVGIKLTAPSIADCMNHVLNFFLRVEIPSVLHPTGVSGGDGKPHGMALCA